MTNNEKALELVQKCLDDWPYAATRVIDIMKRLEHVKAMLKEQEAVRPRRIDGKRNHFIKCGNCNYDLMAGFKFCPHCGQAVKWE